jgi:mycofactocin system glycosyltransferase
MRTVATTANARDRDRLPVGFEIRLRADVIRADRGKVLVGGSPARVLRLSRRAQGLLTGGRLVVAGPASATLARRLLDANVAAPVVDDVDVSSAGITVVVPVRDRAEQLDRCLAAIVPLPVIVVDDASDDRAATARVARRYGAGLVSLAENLGPAGARNAGLAQVTTPLVAFVDSDVVVEGAALLDLARHCADPLVALVGPAVVGRTHGGRPRWFERYDAVASSLDLGRVGGQVLPGAAIGWLPSACLVGRVDLLGNGFDPALRVAEDVDLVWRLVEDGKVVRYDPSVVAHHETRSSVRQWLGRKFVYGTGGADLAIRHGSKVAPGVLSLVSAFGAAAVLQRRWWSAPLAAAVVAITTRSLRRHLPIEDSDWAIAVRLSSRGLGWAVRQECGLLLRHWWPLAALAASRSRVTRRAVGTAVAVDLVLFLRNHPGIDPTTALVARRLDDMAYGSGLWWGAIRRRHAGCLTVRLARQRSTPGSLTR